MTREEWEALPPKIRSSLALIGVGPTDVDTKAQIPGSKPYTQMGAASIKGEGMMPSMNDSTGGVTITEGLDADGSVPVSTNSFIAYNPTHMKDPKLASLIRGHEVEHALANQGGGQKKGLYEQWRTLATGADSSPSDIVARLEAALPYLQEKWGLPKDEVASSYFKKSGNKPTRGVMINELFPTLSALEQQNNKRLTDDPYMRENVFKTEGDRETYNALTGLRQTRLDAKDLPPYTRQRDEQNPGATFTGREGYFDKIKAMLKQYGGGG